MGLASNLSSVVESSLPLLNNGTSISATNTSCHDPSSFHMGYLGTIAVAVIYLMAILGNLSALWFLCFSDSAPRNPRHAFLLRSLALNDLIAMVGMWILMGIKNVPWVRESHAYCVVRTVWRSFGLGSGCIVCVMAIDRWIALTRPFFYQKYITLGVIKKGALFLWLLNLLVVCLPFFGFGAYFREDLKVKCIRYKLGERYIDRAYAYVYFALIALFIVTIIHCNMEVVRALTNQNSKQNANGKKPAVLIRRISRNKDLHSSATTEETAFARVMGLLCIVFVLCWVPQLISVPLVHKYPKSKKAINFVNAADLILALHFVIDPFFYNRQRCNWFKDLCKKRPSSRGNSVKTTHELISL